MILRYLHKILNCSVVFLSLLFYTHYFSYFLWEDTRGPKLIWIFILGCFMATVLLMKRARGYDLNNRRIFAILFIPVFAGFIKIMTTTQSLETERISILLFFATLQYFFLKELRVSEKQIVYTITLFGLITLALQVYQQTPESIPLFGIVNNDEANMGSERNGVFRFYIGCYYVAVFCLLYWWASLFKKVTVWRIILVVCFLASTYLYMVRQLIIISLLAIFLSFFFIQSRKAKIWGVAVAITLSILLITFYELLFENLVDDYRNDTWTTDIRFRCMDYVLGQIFDNPFLAIIGHGHDIIEKVWMRNHFFIADIGFIGQAYYYGLVWVVLYFSTLYVYCIKKYEQTPLGIKLFMIGTMINSPFAMVYTSNSDMFLWICLLYIGHLHIDNKNYQYCHLIAK